MTTTDPFLRAVALFPRYLLAVRQATEDATSPHESTDRLPAERAAGESDGPRISRPCTRRRSRGRPTWGAPG